MIEYFRDPAWQFVGAVLALAAIAATIVVYVLQRQRKRLAYELVSKNQLLTVKEELEGKLQVLYDGQPTRDICLLVVKIVNNGNVAIASSDYEKELSISTGVASKILSAAITELEPDNLNVDLAQFESQVAITPTLLNPRDAIFLKLIVSDFDGRLSVDARILGVKRIEAIGSNSGFVSLLMALAFLIGAVGFIFVAYFDPKPIVKPPTPIEVKIGIAMVVISYFLILFASFRNKRLQGVVRSFVRLVASASRAAV